MNVWRKQFRWVNDDDGFERKEMQCRCGHWQMEEPPQDIKVPARILYFDIETAPFKLETQRFDLKLKSGYLDWHDITKPFFIISWAAAWVTDEEPRIMSDAVTGWEAKRRKDKRCIQGLWDLINDADYVVGHNSKAFDVKKVETRFFLNGLRTPCEFKQRDTLTMARQRFKSESNALAYWSWLLGGNPKDHMVWDDWLEVVKGNQRVINKMRKYNKGDVHEGINILKQFVEYIESNGSHRAKVFP
jgi:hypothetical protein